MDIRRSGFLHEHPCQVVTTPPCLVLILIVVRWSKEAILYFLTPFLSPLIAMHPLLFPFDSREEETQRTELRRIIVKVRRRRRSRRGIATKLPFHQGLFFL